MPLFPLLIGPDCPPYPKPIHGLIAYAAGPKEGVSSVAERIPVAFDDPRHPWRRFTFAKFALQDSELSGGNIGEAMAETTIISSGFTTSVQWQPS